MCNRVSIPMNFSKESVRDLPSKNFDQTIPTFWLLEGLVMYLDVDTVKSMLNEIYQISANNSCILVNYLDQCPASKSDFIV